MSWLNYHHLLYFYTVAREGGVARAAETLHLTQPTVSAQVRALERALGERLFEKRGRRLALTDAGRVAYRYAEEIFALGREFQDVLRGRPSGRPPRLVVGVAESVPKLVAYRLLEVVRRVPDPPQLVCHEGTPERLLAELAAHEIELLISDAPPPASAPGRVYSHVLGETGTTVFGVPALAERHRRRFPQSLEGAPFLLPGAHVPLRRALDQWFATHGVQPRVEAEFADSALLKTFGQAGGGLFAGPTAIEAEIRRQYGVRVIGRLDEVRETFYAVSAQRRITHPALAGLADAAREKLFA
ncbi:LysR family transcriptional regulator [Roseisolibacter sp. H3M3-2]|uniref:LysR family transcriptional regulator n=1 Tax=Roseisolibacter sp. H3M3-2 TaxID=3031323 RepID=UPI0023DB8B5B|nr:LysR family transcriptional regulator [Roseisolibacter sp. H3M3-2]MDF1505112.1 LysR family transcriptional regulator [Roseisolibacter sp. H3M3-2]